MLFRIYLVIFILTNGLLLAQSKMSNADRETIGTVQQKGDEKTSNSNSARALIQNIANMEKSVAAKVADLEKLQAQAVEFNPQLQKEMFIIDEMTTTPIGPNKTITTRHIEYTFEGGNKIKEIRIISRRKHLNNDIHSIVRTLTFTPGNPESIKVTVDKFDSRVKGVAEVENYKDFPAEIKLQALKSVDSTLLNTIFRLDTFIQRSEAYKIEKNKSRLEGL